MHIITDDIFYDFVKKYDPDSEHHTAGVVDYNLLFDDKPYEGLKSHRRALLAVFECLAEESLQDMERARERWGDDIADKMHPLTFDIDEAQPSPLDPGEFFYCPEIVKTDYYGNVWYDADWRPDDENFGTTVPYWYALMEPVYGRKNKPEDFRKVNDILFPNGTDALDIYEWTTNWSEYFDDGHEWYGACCWSIYDRSMDRYIVMIVSATD